MKVSLGRVEGGMSTEVLMYNFAVLIHKDFDCSSSCFSSIFAALYLVMLFQEMSLNIGYFLPKRSGRKTGGKGIKSFFLKIRKRWMEGFE